MNEKIRSDAAAPNQYTFSGPLSVLGRDYFETEALSFLSTAIQLQIHI